MRINGLMKVTKSYVAVSIYECNKKVCNACNTHWKIKNINDRNIIITDILFVWSHKRDASILFKNQK